MPFITFQNFYFFSTITLLLVYVWLIYFKLNNYKVHNSVTLNISNKKLKFRPEEIINNSHRYVNKLLIIYLYILHGKNNTVVYNHFIITNFSLYNFMAFLFVNYFIYFLISFLDKGDLTKSTDYFFSISNLLLLLPLIFFLNNILVFLFFIEMLAVLVFYKLISSKIWFKKIKGKVNDKTPQKYVNMVFFQFWVTFFSTIFVVFFYINVLYLYGTTDWSLTQFVNVNTLTIFYKSTNNSLKILILIFIFSIIFKLGVTPLHLFKLEVYKGIPLLSVLFYTIYFLLIFLFFFLTFIADLSISFDYLFYPFFFILVIAGCMYLTSLIFDINFIKVFLAYSTIINTIGFLIIIISSF